MRILVHCCCSICAIHPLRVLKEEGFDVTLLWYNPNIHPYSEYQQRLESLRALQKLWGLDIIYINNYWDFYKFLRLLSGKESERCEICYNLRLTKTAETAASLGIELFTTTLLVSPYQKYDNIVRIGSQIGSNFNINFMDRDFREGFRQAQTLSKELGLYRQKYCGCIYSEAERYLGRGSYE